MSFTTALYEGDSAIHRLPRASAPSKTRSAGGYRTSRAATALETAELATALLKGSTAAIGAVWNALRTMVLWIDEKSRQAHYRRVEGYLAQSSDHADLERRLRDLERSNQFNWIDCGSR